MEEDFFLIDMPIFQPKYEKDKIYGHSTIKRKNNTIELLTEETKGYCMYCFNRIEVNGNNYGHIEHGIEVSNSKTLEDCVPNLGLSCNKCNQSYKSRNEGKRKLTRTQKKDIESCVCSAEKCKSMCSTFSACRKAYVEKWKIILQPFGVENENHVPYSIQFNLLTGEFKAKENQGYSDEDKNFIDSHIKFFGLNDVQRRNKELAIYCKNVISENSILRGITVNHLVVELFREKLSGLSLENAIKVCKTVYIALLQAQYT